MPNLYLEVRDEGDDRGQNPAPLPEDEALALLASADFAGAKLIPWGSNYSFAVALGDDERGQLAIYKPRAGEAPLYDFPDGTLYKREVAAYLLSRAAGWDLVPPTVARDGPHGVGSVQLYVEPEPEGRDPAPSTAGNSACTRRPSWSASPTRRRTAWYWSRCRT